MKDFGINLKKSCDFILYILSIPVNFFVLHCLYSHDFNSKRLKIKY